MSLLSVKVKKARFVCEDAEQFNSYVTLKLQNVKSTTVTVKGANPSWEQDFLFETNDMNTGLLVEVWCKGFLWDRFLGYYYVPLSEVSYMNEEGSGQWVSLDSELEMRGAEIIGTKKPTGHSLLIACRLELPFDPENTEAADLQRKLEMLNNMMDQETRAEQARRQILYNIGHSGYSEDSDYTSDLNYPVGGQGANSSASQFRTAANQLATPQRSLETSRENSYERDDHQIPASVRGRLYGPYGGSGHSPRYDEPYPEEGPPQRYSQSQHASEPSEPLFYNSRPRHYKEYRRRKHTWDYEDSQDGWYSEGYDYHSTTKVDSTWYSGYSDTEYYPSTTVSSRRRGPHRRPSLERQMTLYDDHPYYADGYSSDGRIGKVSTAYPECQTDIRYNEYYDTITGYVYQDQRYGQDDEDRQWDSGGKWYSGSTYYENKQNRKSLPQRPASSIGIHRPDYRPTVTRQRSYESEELDYSSRRRKPLHPQRPSSRQEGTGKKLPPTPTKPSSVVISRKLASLPATPNRQLPKTRTPSEESYYKSEYNEDYNYAYRSQDNLPQDSYTDPVYSAQTGYDDVVHPADKTLYPEVSQESQYVSSYVPQVDDQYSHSYQEPPAPETYDPGYSQKSYKDNYQPYAEDTTEVYHDAYQDPTYPTASQANDQYTSQQKEQYGKASSGAIIDTSYPVTSYDQNNVQYEDTYKQDVYQVPYDDQGVSVPSSVYDQNTYNQYDAEYNINTSTGYQKTYPDAYNQDTYNQGTYKQDAYNRDDYKQDLYNEEVYKDETHSQEVYAKDTYKDSYKDAYKDTYHPDTYAQEAYKPDSYVQDTYKQGPYTQETYEPDVYSKPYEREPYKQDTYKEDAYSQDAYKSVSQANDQYTSQTSDQYAKASSAAIIDTSYDQNNVQYDDTYKPDVYQEPYDDQGMSVPSSVYDQNTYNQYRHKQYDAEYNINTSTGYQTTYPDAYKEETYTEDPYNQETYNQGTYKPDAYSQETYEPDVYSKPYEQEPYKQDTYKEDAYSQDVYKDDAYSQDAYKEDTYSQDTFKQDTYKPDTYKQDSFSKDTYKQDSFSKDTYKQDSISKDTYKRDSFSKDVYKQDSFSKDVYKQDSFSKDVYKQDSFSKDTYKQDSFAQDTYTDETYKQDTYADETYKQDTYADESYKQDTYPEETYKQDTYVEDTYKQDTYDQDTYKEDMYNKSTYNQEAYNKDAYNQETYNRDTYAQDGFTTEPYGQEVYDHIPVTSSTESYQDPYAKQQKDYDEYQTPYSKEEQINTSYANDYKDEYHDKYQDYPDQYSDTYHDAYQEPYDDKYKESPPVSTERRQSEVPELSVTTPRGETRTNGYQSGEEYYYPAEEKPEISAIGLTRRKKLSKRDTTLVQQNTDSLESRDDELKESFETAVSSISSSVQKKDYDYGLDYPLDDASFITASTQELPQSTEPSVTSIANHMAPNGSIKVTAMVHSTTPAVNGKRLTRTESYHEQEEEDYPEIIPKEPHRKDSQLSHQSLLSQHSSQHSQHSQHSQKPKLTRGDSYASDHFPEESYSRRGSYAQSIRKDSIASVIQDDFKPPLTRADSYQKRGSYAQNFTGPEPVSRAESYERGYFKDQDSMEKPELSNAVNGDFKMRDETLERYERGEEAMIRASRENSLVDAYKATPSMSQESPRGSITKEASLEEGIQMDTPPRGIPKPPAEDELLDLDMVGATPIPTQLKERPPMNARQRWHWFYNQIVMQLNVSTER